MDSHGIVERLKHNFAQFGAGDSKPFLDFLANDVVAKFPPVANAPWSGVHVGKNRMIWCLDRIAEAVEFEAFELLDVFGSGERYAVHMRERIRVKRTGRRIEHEQILLYRIREGLIVEYQEFGDTEALRAGFQA